MKKQVLTFAIATAMSLSAFAAAKSATAKAFETSIKNAREMEKKLESQGKGKAVAIEQAWSKLADYVRNNELGPKEMTGTMLRNILETKIEVDAGGQKETISISEDFITILTARIENKNDSALQSKAALAGKVLIELGSKSSKKMNEHDIAAAKLVHTLTTEVATGKSTGTFADKSFELLNATMTNVARNRSANDFTVGEGLKLAIKEMVDAKKMTQEEADALIKKLQDCV